MWKPANAQAHICPTLFATPPRDKLENYEHLGLILKISVYSVNACGGGLYKYNILPLPQKTCIWLCSPLAKYYFRTQISNLNIFEYFLKNGTSISDGII